MSNSIFHRLKPGVKSWLLLLISGLMWVAIGLFLIFLAIHWLVNYGFSNDYYYILPGILAALVIHYYGFLRIVDKNLGRIRKMNGKPCVFSFMSWKSYLIVVIMMTMGITLRHSSVPKQYLAILYIAIGLALFLSSFRYFRYLIYIGFGQDY